MPSPEESNAAMRIIEKFRGEYDAGGVGLPPGQDWVDSAFAYMEHAGIYSDEAAARELLEGYDILTAPPPAEPPTFDEALEHPQWWQEFRTFLVGEYSSENPDFVDAVRYGSMEPQAIYDTFVAEGSERQVNLPAGTRRPIDDAFAEADPPGYEIFATASDDIVALMRRDSWPRFLKTLGQ